MTDLIDDSNRPHSCDQQDRRISVEEIASRWNIGQLNPRMTVQQIAERLNLGRQTVYDMLEQGILPGIRLGQRWLITRHAYEEWERNCGIRNRSDVSTGLRADTEVRS